MKFARPLALPLCVLLFVFGCARSAIVDDDAGSTLQNNGDVSSDDGTDDSTADTTDDATDSTDDTTADAPVVGTKSTGKDAGADAAAPAKIDASTRDAATTAVVDASVPATIVDAAIAHNDAAVRPVVDAATPAVVDSGTKPVTHADAAVSTPNGACHAAADCTQACIGFAVPCCTLRSTCGCSLGLLCF